MTGKRYKLHHDYRFGYGVEDTYDSDRLYLDDFNLLVDELNTLNDENEQLKQQDKINEDCYKKLLQKYDDLKKESEQLKQDRNALIHLLENQSMIIEELHSILLTYQLKEPIVLTKEDLNLMGKAISYYTHGRCTE